MLFSCCCHLPTSTVPGCAGTTDPVLLRSRSRWRLCSACTPSSRGRSVSDEETSHGWTRPLESTHCPTRPTAQTARVEGVGMGSSIRSGLSWAVWSFLFQVNTGFLPAPTQLPPASTEMNWASEAVIQRSLAPRGGLKTPKPKQEGILNYQNVTLVFPKYVPYLMCVVFL